MWPGSHGGCPEDTAPWGDMVRALPRAAAQLKEWQLLPKAWGGQAGGARGGTAPVSGWVTGQTSCTHPATALHQSLQARGDNPARDPAVTVPGQAATPPARPGAIPCREGLRRGFQPLIFQPHVSWHAGIFPFNLANSSRAEHHPHSNTLSW